MIYQEELIKISRITTRVQRKHGGKNALVGRNIHKILDFSVSINPYTPSMSKLIKLKKIKINEYPDPTCTELKNILAEYHNLQKSNIFIANGSAEIITLLFFCFVNNSDTIMALWPSYGDYRYYATVTKTRFIPILVNPPNFFLNINAIIDSVKLHNPKLFFFCNPTNPSGKYYSEKEVETLLDNTPRTTIFILDEAYVNFTSPKWDSIKFINKYPNLIILRSFTKDYALTAFRIGYSVSFSELVTYLETTAPSWHVNSYAQVACIQMLKDTNFLKNSVIKIKKEKLRMTKRLLKLGYEVIPSDINSFLLKVENAKRITNFLLEKNIYVRDCSSYDLPKYIRISVKKKSDNNKLLFVLKALRKSL